MINYKPPKPDDKLCAFDVLGVSLIVFFIVTMCFLPTMLFN
jgi:hypothetical protein